MKSESLSDFAPIWRLRFQQKNTEAEAALEELLKKHAQKQSFQFHCQVSLLQASLLRSKGRLSESNEKLEALSRDLQKIKERPPFQYYLQKAINLFAADDFSVSLEFFLLADSVADRNSDRSICLMNILACLDNLNLPWESTLDELERVLHENAQGKGHADPTLEAAVRKQLRAFQLRRFFRNGQPHEIQSVSLSSEMEQSHYYRSWVFSLPYLFSKEGTHLGKESLEQLGLSKDFYSRSYRLRTIMPGVGTSDIEGAGVVQVGHQVDRIYLWTWRWLADPSESNRQLLRQALLAFDFSSALTKMTFEDFQLLRNALGWVSIFQKQLTTLIEQYFQLFSTKDFIGYPILDYERTWIGFVATQGSLPSRPESHPLYKNAAIQIPKFVHEWLEGLRISSRPIKPTLTTVFVNEETHQIFTKKKVIISEPLTQVLLRLHQDRSMDFATLLWVGFGTASFDPDRHVGKIYNCISRLKELLPKSVSLKTKNSRIYWEGPKEAVQRVPQRLHQVRLFQSSSELKISQKPGRRRVFEKPVHPRMLLERSQGKDHLTREELQDLMGTSKATTVRWIEKWVKQGLIEKKGSGRSTTYSFKVARTYRLTISG